MNRTQMMILGVVALAGLVTLAGCGKKPESVSDTSPGFAERTGAALDTAAEKTADAAKATAVATRDATGKAIEKTGEVLEKAGGAVEEAGAKMREPPVVVEE